MATPRTLTAELNRLAGTTGQTATRAANVWAGTTGQTLRRALNVKASTTAQGLAVAGVCNVLASTSKLTAADALSRIP